MPIRIPKGDAEKATSGARGGDHMFVGLIEEVDGTTPGPASGLKYKVRLNLDGGTFITPLMSPATPRWPDAVNVVAFQLSQPVLVIRSKNTYYLMNSELPSIEECEEIEPEPEP